MKQILLSLIIAAGAALPVLAETLPVQLGPRPFYLVDQMADGELKETLKACAANEITKSDWSIGHRGAPMMFPEHTEQSYRAAAVMGAGIIECDVTFTKDRELVCRHAQNDLHATTNILDSDLAGTCVKPFAPANGDTPASAECRTSEITLAQFRTLDGKMDATNNKASDVSGYMNGTAGWRTDLYARKGKLMTHGESIELLRSLGAKFTPELKSPSVEMPFEGEYTQEMYAQQMIDDYKKSGVPASDVFAQSFNLEDVLYWIENEPEFGRQAVYLDDSYETVEGWKFDDPSTWDNTMASLKERGVNYIAPPMWVLVTVEDGKIVPSIYAKEAKAAGLEIITWTAERSGLLSEGGGWYYQTITEVTDNEGDVFELLHVLHNDVGIAGIFSDWPATATYYANCFKVGL